MRIGNDFSRTNDDKPSELLAPVTKNKESRPESEQNVESFFLSSDSSGVLPPEKFDLSNGYMLVPGDANYNYSSNGLNSRDLLDLCGVPGICRSTAQRHCFNVTLADCPDCSDAASGFFVFLVLCLGLAILFGNLVILAVSTQLYKMRRATNVDWFKASLAVSDLMTGLQIFFVAFPNFAWSLNSTLEQILVQVLLLQNSGPVIVGGVFYFVTYTASLYHLLLMSAMRLYAINWPYQYRQLSINTVYKGIGVAWIFAGCAASFPAWFPQYFNFDYYHMIFLYLPSLIISPSSSFTPAIIVLFVLLVIPYVLMTLILISTAISVRKQVAASTKRLGKRSGDSNQDWLSREEIAAFKSVSLMQVGFTVTLVPWGITGGLLYFGVLTCDTQSTPYMICLYLSMTNSLVNVLVYSVYEKKFRSTARIVFRKLKPNIYDDSVWSSYTKPTTTSNSKSRNVATRSSVVY